MPEIGKVHLPIIHAFELKTHHAARGSPGLWSIKEQDVRQAIQVEVGDFRKTLEVARQGEPIGPKW